MLSIEGGADAGNPNALRCPIEDRAHNLSFFLNDGNVPVRPRLEAVGAFGSRCCDTLLIFAPIGILHPRPAVVTFSLRKG